jgi:hypothetical protein
MGLVDDERARRAHDIAQTEQAGPPEATKLTFYLSTALGRLDALDRRQEITEALEPLGIRVSLNDCGTTIYLVDEGVPTLAEQMNGIVFRDRDTVTIGEDDGDSSREG